MEPARLAALTFRSLRAQAPQQDGRSPLLAYQGRLGFGTAFVILAAMLPVLYAAAWTWHRVKTGHPHAARLVLAFLTVYVLWEFATRPW